MDELISRSPKKYEMRSVSDALDLKPMMGSSEAYAQRNAILVLSYSEAMEIIRDKETLRQVTQSIIDWISRYNRNIGYQPEIDDKILMYLHVNGQSSKEQNVIEHEAQHLAKLPEHMRDSAQLVVYAFGALTRPPETFDDWDNIPLFISQVAGIVVGVNMSQLTPEQTIEAALAPNMPSHMDILLASQTFEELPHDHSRRKEFALLLLAAQQKRA